MQNQPNSTYTGGSQPHLSAPFSPYPPPPIAQPVSQSNSIAITALVFGIVVLIGTVVFLGLVMAFIGDLFDSGMRPDDIRIFLTLYIIGGIFSLCSIAFGLAGMIEGKLKGGRGLAGSSFAVASGCFFFFSTFISFFIILLLGAHYR